jgi:hypothetical protein
MLSRLVLVAATVLATAGAGCSGINTSHSVSPATFLIPGLFGQVPAPGTPPADPATAAPSAADSF